MKTKEVKRWWKKRRKKVRLWDTMEKMEALRGKEDFRICGEELDVCELKNYKH